MAKGDNDSRWGTGRKCDVGGDWWDEDAVATPVEMPAPLASEAGDSTDVAGNDESARPESTEPDCVPCACDEFERVVGSKSATPQAEAKAIERLEHRARDALACSKTPAQRDVENWRRRRDFGACVCTIVSPLR